MATPSHIEAALYVRLKVVCCHEWGIPPYEFDRAAALDLIAVEDVLEAIALRGGSIHKFLFREREAERAARLKAIRSTYHKLRSHLARPAGQRDETRIAALSEELKRLNTHG